MKFLFRGSIALFIALFLFYSCKNKKFLKPVVNPTITLTKGQESCSLKLSDNGKTRTLGNNLVTWKCSTGVKEILAIFYKSGDSVFKLRPRKMNPSSTSSDWFAITKNTKKELSEEYGIEWVSTAGDTCKTDPTIKVDPDPRYDR